MTQTAPDRFTVTRQCADPRADGGTRVVHVRAQQIVIERMIQNVRMTVSVPVAAYRGLVIAVRPQAGTAALRLRHEDPDLDVVLAAGDPIEIAKKAKAWGALFEKPISIEKVGITIFPPFKRGRQRPKRSRRSTFSKRRRIGESARAATSFAGEREIIART